MDWLSDAPPGFQAIVPGDVGKDRADRRILDQWIQQRPKLPRGLSVARGLVQHRRIPAALVEVRSIDRFARLLSPE